MHIKALLTERIETALAQCGAPGPAIIKVSGRPDFGHYQANGIMALAKKAGQVPRDLALSVMDAVDLTDVADRLEVAGPGFINIHLNAAWIASELASDAALITTSTTPLRVVVDYSSPNLAKEMHVGHLRSTIIGDAYARTMEALGHLVIRQNHVGDWGTQFGMLLTHMQDIGANSVDLSDLEAFYRAAKVRFDEDADFASKSRSTVVALQSGDPKVRGWWQQFIDISLSHCQELYTRLDVSLTPQDVCAESSYNDDLPVVVADLTQAHLLTESDGAMCVFLDEFTGKDGAPLPVIVQKSDGGYLYSTTDLAAIRYRNKTLNADRAAYFVDARQSLHFRQIFSVARVAGFAPERLHLEHMPFGTMMGKDGKPFQTRTGGVVKLADLLDEAQARATALVKEKNPALDETSARSIGNVVGIGAIKYADLSKNRTSDYVFDWDLMLSFDGNTSPYLQYAYSRISSIFSRGEVDRAALSGTPILNEEAEVNLGLSLIRFQETLEQIAAEGFPHHLCAYLYDLATRFMQFYETCPVLTSEGATRHSRLLLAARTAQTLQEGLNLLGIRTIERM
ncbi:MAG: arginine--tRNA ligase [Proteobacteria bacterium]|nr:arginine--tRNA ligase [Pseudomonadota bacterium]